jgi:hypothetical protein
MINKHIAIAFATAACALATGAAHAGNVHWSVGISLPPVGTVISNAPVYAAPAPVYYEPAPVYYQPAPVYYQPAPVYVAPPRVVYRPVPVVVRGPVIHANRYYGRGHHRHGHHDEYGNYYGNGQWQPVPADPRRKHHERDR